MEVLRITKGERRIHDGMPLHALLSPDSIEAVKHFETTADDICVAGYPRSGTTWMQQIMALMHPEACPANASLIESVPTIEYDEENWKICCPNTNIITVKDLKTKNPPRLFKSHLPARYFAKKLQENKLKVIFIIRNVKDTLVSYFNYVKQAEFPGDFHFFFKLYQEEKLPRGDYFKMVQSWLEMANLPNVLIVCYEDMKKDLTKELKRIGHFCNKNLSEEQLQLIKERSSVSAMKKDAKANYMPEVQQVFKGLVGEWPKYFSREESAYVDEIIKQHPWYQKIYCTK